MATVPDADSMGARERALWEAYELFAASDRPLPDRIDRILEHLRRTIGTEFATLSRVHEDADEYIFERVSAPGGDDVDAGMTAPLSATNCQRVVETRDTLVLEDVEAQAPELADPEFGIASYLGAPVVVDGEVYGTFCFYGTEPRSEAFADWEVALVRIVSAWVSSELQHRRTIDRLRALNELNEVVRRVTSEFVDGATRAEVREVACRGLAASDAYKFAWIGEADPHSGTLAVTAAAGVDDWPGGDPLAAAPDVPLEELPPPSRALLTGELVTCRAVDTDPSYGRWGDLAERHGFASSASVPLRSGESVTGVLTVHADRPDAFEGEERSAMAYLGTMLDLAVAAAERKRALTSTSLVEVTVEMPGALDHPVGGDSGATVTLTEFFRASDGSVTVHGDAPADVVESLDDGGDSPPWRDVEPLRTGDDRSTFRAEVSDLPVLSVVESLSGRLEELTVDGADVGATLTFPADVDVRRVVESLRDAHPEADLVARREVTRPGDPWQHLERGLADALTERQLETLRAAHAAGYFDRPRQAAGEEVAASLGITSSTFSQHLRAAQQNLFDALLSDSPDR